MYHTRSYRGKSHLKLENAFQKVMKSLHRAKKPFVLVIGYNEHGDLDFWKITGKGNICKIKDSTAFVEECDFSATTLAEILSSNGFPLDAKSLRAVERGIL